MATEKEKFEKWANTADVELKEIAWQGWQAALDAHRADKEGCHKELVEKIAGWLVMHSRGGLTLTGFHDRVSELITNVLAGEPDNPNPQKQSSGGSDA